RWYRLQPGQPPERRRLGSQLRQPPAPQRLSQGLPADGGGRAGDAGPERHLLRQAVPRGRPDRWALRRQRLHLLVAVRRLQRPDKDPLQPVDRFGADVLEPGPALRGQGRAGLRHRDRGGRRRVRDLGYAEHPHAARRHGPWRPRTPRSAIAAEGLAIARSVNGGASFQPAHQIATFTRYFPSDGARDCGDGALVCPSEFVFFRVPLEPRVTADQSGGLPGIYATYNAVDPATVVPSTHSSSSAGANSGRVGRSVVYVIRSVDNGATWSAPTPVDPAGGRGHQYFSGVDALGGNVGAVWQDNRTDDAYSVQLPIGNTLDAQGRPVSSGTDVVGTYASVSDGGTTFTPMGMISSATHQPSYEMFGNRQIPFQGDYNWVALALDGDSSVFSARGWTDNRDVRPGVDIRETDYVDGFDVFQCRTPTALEPDQCPNAHGLDQNIYGQSLTLPVG